MNRYFLVMAVLLLTAVSAFSQSPVNGLDTVSVLQKDSVIYVQSPVLDSTLAGADIFSLLGNVTVNQPSTVRVAMKRHIDRNASRAIQGYRIRIFFDNRQTARNESERIQKEFSHLFPEMRTYRSYINPYFKVTVGDFRTRSEAMIQLNRIRSIYPSAFLVKENISYPVVDRRHPVIKDTVRVSVPVSSAVSVF